MKEKTEIAFLVEDTETGEIRISNNHDYMSKLMLVGMDYATLLLEGKTSFKYAGAEIKVSWLDDVKVNEFHYGTFKEGNA